MNLTNTRKETIIKRLKTGDCSSKEMAAILKLTVNETVSLLRYFEKTEGVISSFRDKKTGKVIWAMSSQVVKNTDINQLHEELVEIKFMLQQMQQQQPEVKP